MRTIRFILGNLDHFRTRFWLNILAAFLDGIVVFFIPVLLSEFTKTELVKEDLNRLIYYLVGCFAASLILQFTIRKWGESLAKQYGNYLRFKYFQIIQHLRVETLLNHHSGFILSLVTKVCDGTTALVFTMIWFLAHSLATLSLFFIYTAKESILIAVLNLIVLIVFLMISLSFSKKMVPIAELLNIKHASLIEKFVDLMANLFTIKKLGVFSFAEKQLHNQVQDNHGQITKLQDFHSVRWFVLHSIYGVAFLSTIIFLLHQISEGLVAASVLILFVSAYAIIRGHIAQLSELVKDLLEMDAYVKTLDSIAVQAEQPTSADDTLTFEKIELSEILHKYAENRSEIRIPSFIIKKGDRVCITGESGQGKSTFLSILGFFIDPLGGRRILNGKDYGGYPRGIFGKIMAVVAQEVELFNISVRDNLCLGKELSDQRIMEVLDGLNLMEWYSSLPSGLDTVVGEKGVKLSTGQKQRINIARGVLLDREVLLFDEPTSHLDEYTERKVVEFLGKNLKDKTFVIISHRPAVADLCATHLVFKNGTLEAQEN